MIRSGGQTLVDCLVASGVTTTFGVPGESYLAVLDGLYEVRSKIKFVLCRNEGGAAFMAAAYGKLTGLPGICLVTRGPGATNAAIGVHTAAQDSVPMILFVGQVATDMQGREAFQELDYRAVFGSVAKWVTQIDCPDRIPEVVARAWKTATSGRPGPVVIALPEDVLSASTEAAVVTPVPVQEPAATVQSMDKVKRMLSAAEKPLLLYGGCRWSDEGMACLQQFAEASHVPVLSAFRYIDQFDNHSPVYSGEAGVGMYPYVKKLIKDADLIVAVDVRFGEMTTAGYTLLDVPAPQQQLIHVHASEAELGKIYQPQLAIQAGSNNFAMALQPVDKKQSREQWCSAARRAYEDALENVPTQVSPVDMTVVCRHLREVLPDNAIITNGAGNFTVWPGKFIRYGKAARLLAPQSGAMGYGLPAAIAAKLEHPERTVVCFAGDGDFQMNCQELATALQSQAQPIVLVINNGIYGTIRAHQEKHYPSRVLGTTMESPDFVTLARAYGFYAERVENTGDFAAAFERALASTTGALLDLNIAAEALTPFQTIESVRSGGADAG